MNQKLPSIEEIKEISRRIEEDEERIHRDRELRSNRDELRRAKEEQDRLITEIEELAKQYGGLYFRINVQGEGESQQEVLERIREVEAIPLPRSEWFIPVILPGATVAGHSREAVGGWNLMRNITRIKVRGVAVLELFRYSSKKANGHFLKK